MPTKIQTDSTVRNPSLEMMMRQSFPDLARAVRGSSPQVLERFRQMVLGVLPSADELTLNELHDHLPQALEDLAFALESTGGSLQRNFLTDSREHGVCRYHQSFNLSELLVEYSILRALIFEEVTKTLGRSLHLEELWALNVALDASSRRAVESFVNHQHREVQAAVDAQSKYLSFLSHDLRGSLNGILLTVEVLRRGSASAPGSDQREFLGDLEMMRRSILDTVSAMDHFLHADQLRRGKVQVKPAEVSLRNVVRDLAAQFLERAKEKGIAIVTDTTVCPSVVTDRELVQLILQNLIGNAVKYTKQGQVRIITSSSDGKVCRVSVEDDGPGIPVEQISQIFKPYTRGPTHGQSGIGLGLSIAMEAASLLKARLWAESELGKGSQFHLEIAGL